MVEGIQKLNQEELNDSLKKDITIQIQQLKLLDNSILLLTDVERTFVETVYKKKIPISKYARDNYMSRPKVYRMQEIILEKVADFMRKLQV